MTTESTEPPELNALAEVRTVAGRKVVAGIVAFAVTMVSLLYLYWHLYTRPFRPLQAAIAAEFPGSSPSAIGGKPKSHLPASPSILRLIVRIDWDPRNDDRRAREMSNRLAEIAARTTSLADYERLEVFLMHRRPEQFTITWSLDAPLNELPLPLEGVLPAEIKVQVTEGVEGS